MTREDIIRKTVQALQMLPQKQAEEVSDFVDFLLQKHEEASLQQNLQQMQPESKAFDFLVDEEDLYSIADLKACLHFPFKLQKTDSGT